MAKKSRRAPKDTTKRTKKKVCVFCKDHIEWVDYKDVNLLRKFMSDRGKIRARRVSGNCAQHQREVAAAIKTARELALLPYTQRMMTERSSRKGALQVPVATRQEIPASDVDASIDELEEVAEEDVEEAVEEVEEAPVEAEATGGD